MPTPRMQRPPRPTSHVPAGHDRISAVALCARSFWESDPAVPLASLTDVYARPAYIPARPRYPARFAQSFESSSSRSKNACATLHSAYAAKPAASTYSSSSPQPCRASAASAPSRLVDFPPRPSASSSASTPTMAKEMPLATRPVRASATSQSLGTCRRTNERFFEIRDEVVDRLDPDGEADEILRRRKRRVGGRRVGHHCRHLDHRLDAAERLCELPDLGPRHQRDCFLFGGGEEGNHAAEIAPLTSRDVVARM